MIGALVPHSVAGDLSKGPFQSDSLFEATNTAEIFSLRRSAQFNCSCHPLSFVHGVQQPVLNLSASGKLALFGYHGISRMNTFSELHCTAFTLKEFQCAMWHG